MHLDQCGACNLALWLPTDRLSTGCLCPEPRRYNNPPARSPCLACGRHPSPWELFPLLLRPSHVSLSLFHPVFIPVGQRFSFSRRPCGAESWTAHLFLGGEFACNDWLWTFRPCAAAVLLRHLQEAFPSANHLRAFSLLV